MSVHGLNEVRYYGSFPVLHFHIIWRSDIDIK